MRNYNHNYACVRISSVIMYMHNYALQFILFIKIITIILSQLRLQLQLRYFNLFLLYHTYIFNCYCKLIHL